MKKIFAIGAASLCCAAPAVAGPYVNVEAKSSFSGTDYSKTVLHNDLGWASKIGDAKFYAQAGPALVIPDGGDQTTELAGKTGIKLKVNKNLGVYGEISAMTKDQIDFDSPLKVGTKVGFKYSF